MACFCYCYNRKSNPGSSYFMVFGKSVKLFEYTRKKHHKKVEKYASWGLLIFVAIPLPFTGAWSGALTAFVFGIEKKKALAIISLGVLIAGIIVTFLVIGGKFLI